MTLPEYTKKMIEDFKDKPEYKRYQAIQQGQMSDAEKLQATQAFQNESDIRNFAQQKELAKYNNDLKSLESNKSLFDVLGKNVGTYEGNRGYDLA